MSADPLSFFAVNDEDDATSSEEEEEDTRKLNNGNFETATEGFLPPPLKALAQAKTPEFVTSHLKTDMDWDKMTKTAPYVPPKEFKPWENSLPSVEAKSTTKSKKPDLALVKGIPQTMAAVPPKAEPQKPQVLDTVDHAVTWSKMYNDSGLDPRSSKRPRPEDDDADLAGFCHTDLKKEKKAFQSKHHKSSHPGEFREKEKRKRDVGQANRDKSFVEEEKRVLRQNFDKT